MSMIFLKQHWQNLAARYSADTALIEITWNDLAAAYNSEARFYHNFSHIGTMIEEIESNRISLADADALLFAAWFHDVVYNPRNHSNEKDSAELAIARMNQLTVPENLIRKTEACILATADHMHLQTANHDLGFFLDCDLKILGADPATYMTYAANVRKEYGHIPFFLYNRGRKKVLRKFIESESIYRTTRFKEHYEEQARTNLLNELKIL